MCVAVIGGLGYIGRHLVQQLLTLGYKVLIIDKNDDRLVVTDLKKFDRSGKGLTVVKLSLPVINNRFKDLIISHGVTTVINVSGLQETPAKTLYLTRYIYCHLSISCKKVRSYIHTTPMEENIGYGYDKRLKLDVYPENWLAYLVVKDNCAHLRVGVLRLPESYGHDDRIHFHTGNHLWAQLESVRKGLVDKVPVHKESVQTSDGTHLRDYCPVFDVAGGIIDMMGYIQNAEGFDFAACDIGSGVNISVKEFINTYKEHHKVAIVTDPVLPGKPRPALSGDPLGGGEMIGWTRIFDSEILSNTELNHKFKNFEVELLAQ